MLLKVGDKAPEFSLYDKDNINYNLSDSKSSFTIIYFYPKDSTPGCTLEAIAFSKLFEDFKKFNAQIIGISGGDNKSKKKFCENNSLKIKLLSDTDFLISKAYGVYDKKSFMGKSYLGISRTTFILDKNKKIIKVFEKVIPIGHAKEVLDFIKSY